LQVVIINYLENYLTKQINRNKDIFSNTLKVISKRYELKKKNTYSSAKYSIKV